jgi:Peptidase M50B-like
MYVQLAAAASPPPGTPAPLSGGEAAIIGLLVLGLVAIPFLWSVVGHVDTMAHEGAHAALAAILGIELIEVIIKPNRNGETRFHPVSFGLRVLLVAFVGYLGPSLFGLGAAKLISTGHVIAVLWVAIVLLVVLFLFLIRGSFGLITVPVAVLLLVLVMRYAHTGLEEIVVYVLTWLLLLAGVRTAFAHGAKADDAKALRSHTFLPRHLWSLLWIVGTIAALCVGGKWLVLG